MSITAPIIPGLKPITNKKQLSVLPRIFHVDIPTDLSNPISKCKTDADCEQVGTEWLIQQSKELKAFWGTCFTLLYPRKTQGNLECGERDCLKIN